MPRKNFRTRRVPAAGRKAPAVAVGGFVPMLFPEHRQTIASRFFKTIWRNKLEKRLKDAIVIHCPAFCICNEDACALQYGAGSRHRQLQRTTFTGRQGVAVQYCGHSFRTGSSLQNILCPKNRINHLNRQRTRASLPGIIRNPGKKCLPAAGRMQRSNRILCRQAK